MPGQCGVRMMRQYALAELPARPRDRWTPPRPLATIPGVSPDRLIDVEGCRLTVRGTGRGERPVVVTVSWGRAQTRS